MGESGVQVRCVHPRQVTCVCTRIKHNLHMYPVPGTVILSTVGSEVVVHHRSQHTALHMRRLEHSTHIFKLITKKLPGVQLRDYIIINLNLLLFFIQSYYHIYIPWYIITCHSNHNPFISRNFCLLGDQFA